MGGIRVIGRRGRGRASWCWGKVKLYDYDGWLRVGIVVPQEGGMVMCALC